MLYYYDMGANQVVLFDHRRQEPWEKSKIPPPFKSQEIAKMQREAMMEAAREHTRDSAKNRQKFNELVQHSQKVLYKIKSVFPFDFFPNTLSIDTEKLTVKLREFFLAGEVRSIYFKDITQVYVDSGPFFSTMYIADQYMMAGAHTKIRLPYLKNKEAMKARRIIQGLVISHKQEIDVSGIGDVNIVSKLEKLGKMQ